MFERFNLKLFLTVVVTSIILTIILTWPFAIKLGTFYKDSGDYAFNASMMWYNEQAIKTGMILNQNEYFNGHQYYPQPYTVAYADHIFFSSLIFSPLYWITNNFVLSVNLVIFLTFILSFTIAYYAIDYFVKNSIASLIGAFVYTFNPQIFCRFPDHLSLLSHYFLPLVFLCCYKFLQSPNLKNAFLFGLIFTLNALTAIYFQISSTLFLIFFATPFFIFRLVKKEYSYFFSLIKYSLILLVFMPIILHFSSGYLEFSQKENATRKLEETLFFSGRLINWFFTNRDNLLYGNFVKNFDKVRSPGPDIDGEFNYYENTLSLNIVPMIFFLTGLIYLLKRYRQKKIDRMNLLVIVSLLLILVSSFILSFGPFFFGWNGKGPYWTLPFYYLYQIFPLLKGMRVPTRFQFFFYFPFSVFVAYGSYYILSKIKTSSFIKLLLPFLLIFLLVENINLKSFENNSFFLTKILQDKSIAQELNYLKGKRILHIPIFIAELGQGNTYTIDWNLLTESRSLNGYSGYIPLEQFTFLTKIKEKLDEKAFRQLASIDTDYIIIHKDLLGKDLGGYKNFEQLYKKGIIYDKNNLSIIDLKKYEFSIKKCDFEKDISKDIKLASLKETNQNFYVLVLKNKSDCYFPSIYKDKYKKIDLYTNDLYGNPIKKVIYFKLPVVIEPLEEIILSQINNNLRIE